MPTQDCRTYDICDDNISIDGGDLCSWSCTSGWDNDQYTCQKSYSGHNNNGCFNDGDCDGDAEGRCAGWNTWGGSLRWDGDTDSDSALAHPYDCRTFRRVGYGWADDDHGHNIYTSEVTCTGWLPAECNNKCNFNYTVQLPII